jgi:four helix bundle protein
MASHYKDLIAWQKAMRLVTKVYGLTERFPKRELYSLCDQIRRAAVSAPSNIAEGQAHFNPREFLHYLRHARGSLAEVETQITIALNLKYISPSESDEVGRDIDEVNRILAGLINSLTTKAPSPQK